MNGGGAERGRIPDFQIQSQSSGVMSSAGNSNEVLGRLSCNPWVLHFAGDMVKVSAFDEQFRGQLRTTGKSWKLGSMVDLVDVGIYAKLCYASVHELIKLMNHKLQSVKIHKKPCEDLFIYLRKIDELLSSFFKSLDLANLTHGVHKLLEAFKESLADAYLLFKRCETRSPIHVNVLNNVPSTLNAIKEEIQRIIPVLRLALVQHQESLTSQVNMERGALGLSCYTTTPNSAASSPSFTDVKHNRSETPDSNVNNISVQNTGVDLRSPQRTRCVGPGQVDVHHLTMHRWVTRTYLCEACHQVGKGCVFSCDKCYCQVHPSCVELNEAIQQLEQIKINKLSMFGNSVNFDNF